MVFPALKSFLFIRWQSYYKKVRVGSGLFVTKLICEVSDIKKPVITDYRFLSFFYLINYIN